MLKLLYFGIFSSTAKAAEFPEYKCLDERNSTVFQAHARTHTHTLPLNNVASAADQNNLWPRIYMQIPSNLVSEWVKQKPDMVIYGCGIHLHRLVKWKALA